MIGRDSATGSADTAHRLLNDTVRRALARVAEGDATACATLYDLTSPVVHRLALLLTRDAAAAQELTVRTYERAWDEAAAYDPSAVSPLVWLLAMTRAEGRGLASAA